MFIGCFFSVTFTNRNNLKPSDLIEVIDPNPLIKLHSVQIWIDQKEWEASEKIFCEDDRPEQLRFFLSFLLFPVRQR